MSTIKIPTNIIPAEDKNPSNLIIFSKPKTGKTELTAQLPNCLLLDFEKGSKMVDAMKVIINNLEDLKEVAKQIKAADYPYDYIAIDTITKLEEIIMPYAEELYSRSPQGKKWFTEGKAKYTSITSLPNGAG